MDDKRFTVYEMDAAYEEGSKGGMITGAIVSAACLAIVQLLVIIGKDVVLEIKEHRKAKQK